MLTMEDILNLGGRGLIDKYNWSPLQLLSSVYSSHEWLPWRFSLCPSAYWDDVNTQRKFIEWAGKQLKIKEMGDWYDVTVMVTVHCVFSS
jgi:hypothetical protein